MSITVSVIGLGYIGLPTAAVLASRGVRVIGVDISDPVITAVNAGKAHILEPELEILLRQVVQSGHLCAVSRPQPADVFIIAVPTPLTAGRGPDTGAIAAAAKSIAPLLARGNLVILESTSPVGTTERLAKLLAQARPDLVFPQPGGGAAKDAANVQIAYCPERVLPGNVLHELTANGRIVGGLTAEASRQAADFYKIFVTGEIVATNARTAELCKLAENSFRDVNIAFANELSMVCDKLGINDRELIRLANRHPRVNILQPGPGVGGHCVAVDPWFIVDSAPEEARLIRTAREVNDYKTKWVIAKIKAALAAAQAASPGKSMADMTVVCLGLTFKPNSDDLRESPAVAITRAVAELGCRVLAVEPNINTLPPALICYNIKLIPLAEAPEALEQAEVRCLLVGHAEFAECAREMKRGECFVDTASITF